MICRHCGYVTARTGGGGIIVHNAHAHYAKPVLVDATVLAESIRLQMKEDETVTKDLLLSRAEKSFGPVVARLLSVGRVEEAAELIRQARRPPAEPASERVDESPKVLGKRRIRV